jgi:hypothetical protein
MPSSTRPSQSLSQPSQISVEGTHPPHPSSVWPSQSLSCALQTSVSGQWAGLPHLRTFSSTPDWQLLSTLSHVSFGSKQSQLCGWACCEAVVHGSRVRSPSGSCGVIEPV